MSRKPIDIAQGLLTVLVFSTIAFGVVIAVLMVIRKE